MASTGTPEAPGRTQRVRPRVVPAAAPADDVLVFEHSGDGFALVGGLGRGASWAGIVDVGEERDSLVDRAWRIGTVARRDAAKPAQIVGPYYARHAVAVPVGQQHVVVFGSDRAIDLRESELVRWAAAVVDGTHGVPADKLLADELELVHVLRALMAYRPDNVRDTLRHVATVAASALSCEVAAIRVEYGGEWITEAIALNSITAEPVEPESARYLTLATGAAGPLVEQAARPGSWLAGTEVASHLTLPLGTHPALGALALGHSLAKPRGFTSLCQRIGRAVAEAADLLITQAATREQLAAERDLLEQISVTDALTGIGNRRAWDAAAAEGADDEARAGGYVLSCDLDGLKAVNDRYGHAAGDALIRATADLLTACVRDSDVVARMGGDEFAVLLRDADREAASAVRARIRRAERLWRVTEHGITPRFSLGLAPILDGDVEDARQRADVLMYASKRRRCRSGSRDSASPVIDRRRSSGARRR